MPTQEFFLTAPLEQLRVLRKPQTLALVGLSETRVRYLEAEGKFPQRLALGDNAVGWLEHEVRLWLAQRATRGPVKPLGARVVAPAPAKRTRKAPQRKGA